MLLEEENIKHTVFNTVKQKCRCFVYMFDQLEVSQKCQPKEYEF